VKIFVTVGFERKPFDRLLRIVDRGVVRGVISRDLIVQNGHSRYRPRFGRIQKVLDFDEMKRTIQASDIIVSHAGVGTVLFCLDQGKIPILFPRRAHLGEHVDDHQYVFAEKLARLKIAPAAFGEEVLIRMIQNYSQILPTFKPPEEHSRAARLVESIRDILNEMGEKKGKRHGSAVSRS